MVVQIAPMVGEPVWRKERSCPRWDALDPDTRTVGLHDQPRDGETESPAAFAALLWRPTRAPRIEFGGARYKLAQISERASSLVSRRAPRPFDTHESRFDLSFVFELSEACVAPRLAVSRNFSEINRGGIGDGLGL
jgi:hypothetical protein